MKNTKYRTLQRYNIILGVESVLPGNNHLGIDEMNLIILLVLNKKELSL